MELLDKRGYLTICLTLGKSGLGAGSGEGFGGKIYLRKADGIREWHESIKVRREADQYRLVVHNTDTKIYLQ